MAFLKRLFSSCAILFFGFIFGAGFIGNDHSLIGLCILVGSLICSMYILFKPSQSKMSHKSEKTYYRESTPPPIPDDSYSNSDISFKITLNHTGDSDYTFPKKIMGKAKFIDHESSIDVGGFYIKGPVYIGSMKQVEGSNDPSVIDPNLKIKKNALSEPLGYWSNYKGLTPEQRGRYLDWLSGGRGDIDDLGYVFIYFYGIERYVFIDAPNDNKDLKTSRLNFIVKELLRLQKIFTDSRSFQSYSNNLLDIIFIKFFQNKIDLRKTCFPEKDPIAAKYVIAKYANENINEPLDSDWALHWLFASGEMKRTKTAREQYPLLRMAFKELYDNAGGLKVPSNKTKLLLNYQPASSGLYNHALIDIPEHWCNPMALKRPINTLVKISENLMPIVRKVAKAMATDDNLEILSTWPLDIKSNPPEKLIGLISEINTFCKEHPISTINSLGLVFGTEVNGKISKAQLTKFANGLGACGWVIVPDPNITATSNLLVDDKIFIYQGNRLGSLSTDAQSLDTKIRLAALVAQSDGEVHEFEVEIIRNIVNRHNDPIEKDYMLSYADWRLSTKTSAAGLKAQIDELKVKDRDDLARILVEVAQADGCLPKDEIKELEKLFQKIGLDASLVAQYLHEASSNSEPLIQNDGVLSESGLPRTEKTSNSTEKTLNLNIESMKAYAESTKEIQSVLSQIFDDVDSELITEEKSSTEELVDVWHNGALDEKHHELMEWIITKEEWALEEVETQCKKMGLLIDGALESINEVAFERFGDSLIEIDDPVVVYRDVLTA